MPNMAHNGVTEHKDGTRTVHKIDEDVRTDFQDALTDLLHVLAAEHDHIDGQTDLGTLQAYLSVEFANALPIAVGHFRAEQAGADGTSVEVETRP
jgi:hypothetical protein